jgi:hypothetical protein
MKNLPRIILLLVTAIAFFSFLVPKGWRISGSAPEKYEIGVFKINGHNASKACGVIRASKKDYFEEEYASLIQTISSQRYLGKRIRLTGYMKSRSVTGWAGFFLRVDNDASKEREPLSFDNMHDRPVKGTADWTKYTIDLDVPMNGSKITFGALLHGAGMVWFDDITLEEIGEAPKEATIVRCDTSLSREPVNADFEQ